MKLVAESLTEYNSKSLLESTTKISKQDAVDQEFFGPVYHGTTADNRMKIDQEGFKIFVGGTREENIRHGYPDQEYAHGVPPPIHHLGYGIYFTTVKAIAKKFNVDSTKGIKEYYLDVPRLAEINFASPKKMMDWWIANGYDPDLAKSGREGRIEATKKLTDQLRRDYDGVWFKGKGYMGRTLDGDQICVFDVNSIHEIDPSLSAELEIGSKVRRTTTKYRVKWEVNTDTNTNEKIITDIPEIPAGTPGVIVGKQKAEPMRVSWKYHETNPHWTGDSEYVYQVKWSKGGKEFNLLDQDIQPMENKKKLSESLNESEHQQDELEMLRCTYPQYTFNLSKNTRFKGDAWNCNLYKGDKYIFGIKGPCSYNDAISSYKNAIKNEENKKKS